MTDLRDQLEASLELETLRLRARMEAFEDAAAIVAVYRLWQIGRKP